jgi:adenylate cyclase
MKHVTDFYNPDVHHQQFVLVRGSDAGISALGYEACILWCQGYPDQAIKKSQEMLALAERFQHPFSLADALCYGGCWFNAMYRDSEALMDYSERLYGLASEIGLVGWVETGGCFYGEALVLTGQIQDGIARIQQGISAHEKIGAGCTLAASLRALAEAQTKGNLPEQGLATIAQAFTLVEETGERHWVAELYRLQGELLLLNGDDIGAESSYEKAIEVAQEQRAKSWELRAATSLARLWERQGKRIQAGEMLRDIYNWFTEGFDSPDLEKAKSLLKKLS